jgi:hypothetical protein
MLTKGLNKLLIGSQAQATVLPADIELEEWPLASLLRADSERVCFQRAQQKTLARFLRRSFDHPAESNPSPRPPRGVAV